VLAHWNDRLFVGDETDGRIYEITGGTASLWFDVSAAMLASTGRPLSSLPGNVHSGLRSLAFHPQFASNGKFYTSLMEQRPANTAGHRYLSDVANPIQADSVLVEWTANPATMVASPASYREVFRVGVPVYDHPIKQIMFRPGAHAVDADYGLLYVAHGDGSVESVTVGGGMGNDARGKILRIDPLATATAPYSVPASNPFVASASMIPEVWSLGHRNPHHLAFARDGTLIVAEDGRDNIDEVNLIQAGANYGWPVREGSLVHLAQGTLYDGVAALPANDESFGYTYPAMQFLHQGVRGTTFTGQALGGGYVVENGSALSGHYFATDFVFTGNVFVTPLAALEAAMTKGPAASLRMAPIAKASILFDHDANPATPPLALPNLGDMTRLAPAYDNSGRVDIRYGQGPRGELYLLSKRDRRVYLVTNSVP
jgi:Glucose / Sorbosone dehydrogenase